VITQVFDRSIEVFVELAGGQIVRRRRRSEAPELRAGPRPLGRRRRRRELRHGERVAVAPVAVPHVSLLRLYRCRRWRRRRGDDDRHLVEAPRRQVRHVRRPRAALLLRPAGDHVEQVGVEERHALVLLFPRLRGGGGEGVVVGEEVLDAPAGADGGEVVGDAAPSYSSSATGAVAGGVKRRAHCGAGGCGGGVVLLLGGGGGGVVVGAAVGGRERLFGERGGGELGADEEEAGVLGGEVVGGVDGLVAVGAQDGAVLDAEHEAPLLPAHVAQRRGGGATVAGGGGGRVDEREAAVLAGEAVGAVDAAVAGGAERGLVGAAEHRGRLGGADVALHPHGRRSTS
jgi:hypothetical protein